MTSRTWASVRADDPSVDDVNLADLSDLALACREGKMRFEGFRQDTQVSLLGWPDDVVEQFLYDHADNDGFLHDYRDLDLCKVKWDVEVIPVKEFIAMPTGSSDGDCIE